MATARRKAVARKSVRKVVRKPARAKARQPARVRKASKAKARSASRAASRSARRSTVKRAASRKPARRAAAKAVAPKPAPHNPVNWFEIPVRDIARAQAFYERVLQTTLSLHDMGAFKMAWFTGSPAGLGATGTLMQSESYVPSQQGSLVYFSVPDIDATLARVQLHGGRVLNPKMSIGEHGFVAHFEDCEGNRVALHSMT